MLFLSRTKKLIFTPYIFITNKDLRLRTLTNNFWLFDNKFLGTWKVIKNCCKFLLHFYGKCASDYMHFRWNSNWEKALALNSFEFNFMKIAYIRIFHFFFFFLTSNLFMECECAFHMKFTWSTIFWIEFEFEAYLISKWTASMKAEEILHKMTEVLCISCQDWSDIRWRHIFRSVSWSITWSLPWPVGTP